MPGGALRIIKARARSLLASWAKELKRKYSALSEDEKQKYVSAGHAATMAHRAGEQPFPRQRRSYRD